MAAKKVSSLVHVLSPRNALDLTTLLSLVCAQLTPEKARLAFEEEQAFDRLVHDYTLKRAEYLDDVAALTHAREDWEEEAEASHIERGGSRTTWEAQAERAGDRFDLRPWAETVERMKAFEELEEKVVRLDQERQKKIGQSLLPLTLVSRPLLLSTLCV